MRRGFLLSSLCLLLGGCADIGPPTPPAPPAPPPPERATPAPPPDRVSAAAAGPVQAIRAFATAYINWTADTVGSQMRSLAIQSVGQARSALDLLAAQSARDYELQQGGIANSGTVEAIAPLRRANQYVVVTRERTTATDSTAYQGLRAAWHVAVASVVQLTTGRWAVSSWQPQN